MDASPLHLKIFLHELSIDLGARKRLYKRSVGCSFVDHHLLKGHIEEGV